MVPPFGRSVGRSSDGVRFVPPPSPLLPPGERTLPLLVVEVVVAEVRGGGGEGEKEEGETHLTTTTTDIEHFAGGSLSSPPSLRLSAQSEATKAAQEEIREFESSEEEK